MTSVVHLNRFMAAHSLKSSGDVTLPQQVIFYRRYFVWSITLSFYSRDPQILKRAFCVCVIKPLLKFSSQIWSPHYKYLIDKVESVQRYVTKRLSGLSQLSYRDRLVKLDLQTLERRRLVDDLVFVTKFCMVYVMFLCLLSYHVVTLVVIIWNLLNISATMTSVNTSLTTAE